MGKAEVFEKLLENLTEVQGLSGCMIMSEKGEVIATNMSKGLSDEKVGALASQAIATAIKVIKELNYGTPETMMIESSRGKFATIQAQKAGVFIIGVGDESMNVGMLKMSMSEAIEAYDAEM